MVSVRNRVGIGAVWCCVWACAVLSAGVFAAPSVQNDAIHKRIATDAKRLESRVIAWRRDIHEHPELSNREFRTAKLVAEHLQKLGVQVTTGVAHTGVVGVLRGGKPGPVVALRADMDGLPVVERTNLPYASKARDTYQGNDVGVMHACGHDNHVAILMGTAELLAGMQAELPGTVKFIFQPAEEGAPKGEEGGAGMMVREGVLKKPDVDAVFGLHISQGDPTGQVSYRSGGMMASAQRFDIEITGRQTHAARPWAGVDPILVGAQIVTALQSIVSRNVDVTSTPAVVSVGQFVAGVRNNIVPDSAFLSGTIRTFDPEVRAPGVPVTFNDRDLTAASLPTLHRVYGESNVGIAARITGAEDFSYYQQEIPGFFFFIGARPPGVAAADAIPNHSPLFYVDEDALLPAVQAMAGLAVDYLLAN